jgi:hypothetical protein
VAHHSASFHGEKKSGARRGGRYSIVGPNLELSLRPVACRRDGRRLRVRRRHLSNGLESFAFVYIWLSIGAALIVLADIFLLGRRQSMGVMDAVWPLTLLYWGPLGLPFYFSFGRAAHSQTPLHEHGHGSVEPPVWQAVFKGAAHCGAGCALGDFAAEWLALGLGLVLLGSPLAARLTLSFVLAYGAGIGFQYFAIAPMRGLSFRTGYRCRGQGGHVFADRLRDWDVRLDDLPRPHVAGHAADRLVLLADDADRHGFRFCDDLSGQLAPDPIWGEGEDVGPLLVGSRLDGTARIADD